MNVFCALAIVGALAIADEPGPSALVGLLGSKDRVERDEAALTLEELGADALPSLRLAEKTAPAEVRSKARSIARSIEGKLLERPTLINLDFQGVPLADAIKTLAARTGYEFQLGAEDAAALARRSITAKTVSPMPFWEALDVVGRAGHFRHGPGAKPWEANRTTVLHLVDGEPPANTLYRGPFRIHLPSLQRRRDRDFGGDTQQVAASRGVLTIELQAFVEPGRSIDYDGSPRVAALDERGRPLPSPPLDADSSVPRNPSWIVPGAIEILQWHVPFGLAGLDDTKLDQVRGTLPVLVSAARPDPLVIPLDSPPGKTYRLHETEIQIQVTGDLAKSAQIEVILTRDGLPSTSSDDPPFAILHRRFGLDDRDGRPVLWIPMWNNVGTKGEIHYRIMVAQDAKPVQLRVHDLVWTSIEIPFAFADVPLP
jgi:hypothetical protein